MAAWRQKELIVEGLPTIITKETSNCEKLISELPRWFSRPLAALDVSTEFRS